MELKQTRRTMVNKKGFTEAYFGLCADAQCSDSESDDEASSSNFYIETRDTAQTNQTGKQISPELRLTNCGQIIDASVISEEDLENLDNEVCTRPPVLGLAEEPSHQE